MYAATLLLRLHKLFTECIENMTLNPPPMYQAHVVLIPQPGKHRSHCTPYRPISLLNNDLKIPTKTLDTRLMQILPNLLSIDQTGFMPGKSSDINIRGVFTHLQLPSADSTSRIMAALDIEKAFHSVAWSYMHKVLELMAFGPEFRNWVKLLYSSPTAQIKLGGELSAFLGWEGHVPGMSTLASFICYSDVASGNSSKEGSCSGWNPGRNISGKNSYVRRQAHIIS